MSASSGQQRGGLTHVSLIYILWQSLRSQNLRCVKTARNLSSPHHKHVQIFSDFYVVLFALVAKGKSVGQAFFYKNENRGKFEPQLL